MKIALIADTHDHLDRLDQALDVFSQNQAEALIHAGDFVAPFTAKRLITFDGAIRAVFGNCDGERRGLAEILEDSVAEGPVTFELGGRRFALAHRASEIPASLLSQADVAVVGHTHSPSQTRRNNTLIINPGECCGRVTGQATVALLDLEQLLVEVINLP